MTDDPGLAQLGWSDDELRRTANANPGLGNDAGLPREVRFLVGVARAIRKRHQEVGMGSESSPALFFLQPNGPEGVPAAELRTKPMLDNGLTQLGGSFWFVGPPVCRALGLQIADWSDDGAIFEEAETLGLGKAPAVLLEPRGKKPTLRHYPLGLGEPDAVKVSALSGEKMDLERVIEIVDEATTSHLDGPSGGANLWTAADEHHVSDKAEKTIQFALKVALHHALPTAVIREEQRQMSGRLDLEVEEPLAGEGEFVRHAILELKVLRSYGSTGNAVSEREVRKAVQDGVSQAVAYRREREAKGAALCCFDMRVKSSRKNCFESVNSRAKREHLELRVWPIYATAEERREAME